jgi:hypothetical protein
MQTIEISSLLGEPVGPHVEEWDEKFEIFGITRSGDPGDSVTYASGRSIREEDVLKMLHIQGDRWKVVVTRDG